MTDESSQHSEELLREQINVNTTYALFLRADTLNKEFGKLHKSIFFFSFKRKNLDYEILTDRASELFTSLGSFSLIFKATFPKQHDFYHPMSMFITSEINAVGNLHSYLFGKLDGMDCSKEEDENNFNQYFFWYREYIKEAKKVEKFLHKKNWE